MQIVDSHVHIWINHPEYPWAVDEPDVPSYDAPPANLIALMQENGIQRAVLVQYIQYRWDNCYTAQALKDYPTLFMGVCRVDPEDPDSPDRLSDWTENYGFRGVRLSPAPDARGDWFTGPLMLPLFKRAADHKIPVVMLMNPSRLPELAEIVEKVPEVDVVIDHMADCLNRNGDDLEKLIQLARYPRVFLKVGHIPQNSSQAYPWRDTHPLFEKVFQGYGSRRIMWGSDWPFSLSRMTYAQSIAYVQQDLKFLSEEDREWILGKTALQFWPFN